MGLSLANGNLKWVPVSQVSSFMTGPYHIETSPLICRANQWTGFYMRGTSVMKELSYMNANAILPWIKIAKSSILAWGLRISKNTNVSFNQNWSMFTEFGIIKKEYNDLGTKMSFCYNNNVSTSNNRTPPKAFSPGFYCQPGKGKYPMLSICIFHWDNGRTLAEINCKRKL